MDDSQILSRIEHLVEEEHRLRQSFLDGELTGEQEQARLRGIETSLDRCWDLLRQRRARRAAGADADDVQARPASQIRGYLQ